MSIAADLVPLRVGGVMADRTGRAGNRRCAIRWAQHECARPPGHEGDCDCYCGTWRGQPDSRYATAYHSPKLQEAS